MSERVDALFAGDLVQQGAVIGLVLGALLHLRTPPVRRRPVVAVLLTIDAALWLYSCTPDTEWARRIVGLATGAGVVAVVARRSWRWPAAVATVLLAYAALVDGAPRDSAVVGGLAVATVHAVAQRRVDHTELGPVRQVLLLAAVTVGGAACAREAGLGPGTLRPVLEAGVAVVAVALACRLLRPAWGPARSDH